MVMIETWIDQDLKKPVVVRNLGGKLFTGDDEANLIGVVVTDDGEAATLTGNVIAYVIRADGATVPVNGTLDGNRASVLLPASCYVVKGRISVVIKVGTTTIGAMHGYVVPSTTDEIVDPGHVIPSIEELLDKIADCEQATDAANDAADKIDDMTVSVGTSTGTPSVELTLVNGHYNLAFSGVKGEQGIQGIQGVKGDPGNDITVSSWSVSYGTSASGSSLPSSWSDSVPNVQQGDYLWTRTIVNYSSGTTTTSYAIARWGVDGSGSVVSVDGISPDSNGNVALGAVKSVDGISPDSSGSASLSALRYASQTLTQAQQEQALTNLGALSVVQNALLMIQQTLSEAQKTQVITNLFASLTDTQKAQVRGNIGIDGIEGFLNSNVFTTPSNRSGAWRLDAGGYIKIGQLVYVCLRVHALQEIPAGSTVLFDQGAFPVPLQDSVATAIDSSLTLSAELHSTWPTIRPYISSSGQLRFSSQSGATSIDANHYISGVYLAAPTV